FVKRPGQYAGKGVDQTCDHALPANVQERLWSNMRMGSNARAASGHWNYELHFVRMVPGGRSAKGRPQAPNRRNPASARPERGFGEQVFATSKLYVRAVTW